MYLLPAGMPARSKTKWGGLGILPAIMDRSTLIDRYTSGATNLFTYPNGGSIAFRPPTTTVPRPPIIPVVEKPTPIVYVPPKPIVPIYPAPRPIPLPILPKPPLPPVAVTPSANTGTPVPGGFPTNQFFVASDGSVWEFGSGKWFNTGTPYSAPGASAPAAATPAPVAS